MTDIWLSGVVTEDNKLLVELPEGTPRGRVNVMIQGAHPISSARESVRAKLAAAGMLVTETLLPPGTRIPTDAEVKAAGKLPPGARPSEELINEDREERF